jgi:predicted DNA binding CopG/RHH family protein
MKKRSDFEWDDTKDKPNQNKHGVSFALAQLAFLDHNRVILEDLEHSGDERERKYMKEKIKYTDEPIGKVKVLKDFLPSPEELALKDETVKVTISLSKTSIDFFKKEAKKYNTQYQKMIRRLLDEYAAHQ